MVVFGIAVALEFISVLFQFSHWATFASDGVGVPGLLGFGQGGCPVPLLPCPLAPPSTSTLDVCTSSWEYSDGVRIPSGVCGLPGHPGPRVDHHLPHPPPPLAFHKCVFLDSPFTLCALFNHTSPPLLPCFAPRSHAVGHPGSPHCRIHVEPD